MAGKVLGVFRYGGGKLQQRLFRGVHLFFCYFDFLGKHAVGFLFFSDDR
jgi:hypothetical protein